jgi:hypothetical protein
MKNLPFLCFAESGEIDFDAGIIRNVSVMTKGPARGHELMIDDTTLEQVLSAANEFQNGVKVKVDHGGGVFSIVGSVKNFRIEGDKLKADLHLLKTAEKVAHILELARELPDTFGMSVSIHGQHETKDGETFARCSRIRSCDIVTDPAANPDGLLSEPLLDTKNNVCMGDTKKQIESEKEDETTMKDWQSKTDQWRESSEKRFASLEALLGEIKRAIDKEGEEDEEMSDALSKDDFSSKMSELDAKFEALSETLKNISSNATPAANNELAQDSAPKDFSEAVAAVARQNAGLKQTEAIKLAEKQFPELRKADLISKGLQLN